MSLPKTFVAVVLAALLGAGIGAGAVVVAVKRGPAGPAGQVGPPGPRGPQSDTEVSAADVQAAIEDDPDAVAASLSGYLDYADIQQSLDPDPADVQSQVEDLQSQLQNLCSDLSFSDALSNDYISC